MKLNRICVRSAVTLAFGLLAVVVLLISALALNSLSRSSARFTQDVQGDAQRVRLGNDVRGAAARRAIAASNLMLVTESSDIDLEKRALVHAHRELGQTMASLKQLLAEAAVPGRGAALFGEMERIEGRYGPALLSVVDQAIDGHRDDAVERMNAECNPLLTSLFTAVGGYVTYERGAGACAPPAGSRRQQQGSSADAAVRRRRCVRRWLAELDDRPLHCAAVQGAVP